MITALFLAASLAQADVPRVRKHRHEPTPTEANEKFAAVHSARELAKHKKHPSTPNKK